jgi:hypothetical protein
MRKKNSLDMLNKEQSTRKKSMQSMLNMKQRRQEESRTKSLTSRTLYPHKVTKVTSMNSLTSTPEIYD